MHLPSFSTLLSKHEKPAESPAPLVSTQDMVKNSVAEGQPVTINAEPASEAVAAEVGATVVKAATVAETTADTTNVADTAALAESTEQEVTEVEAQEKDALTNPQPADGSETAAQPVEANLSNDQPKTPVSA